MKRLIAFIVCLALCISSVLIGVMNVANKAEGIASEGALEGLAAGVTSTPTPEVENTNGAIEPDATKGENYYVLTGNVTVSSVDDLAAVQTALNAGGTFDGQGYTLTTTINGPMFTSLTSGTIKNLVVDGNVVFNAEVGVFAQNAAGVDFDTVNVKATVTRNSSLGGFVGGITAETIFKNCEFSGKILGTSGTGGYGGGFSCTSAAPVTFINCTTSGTINKGANMGGFIAAARAGNVTIIDCKSTATFDAVNTITPNGGATANGAGGFIGKINDTGYNKYVKIENSVSEATFMAGGSVARSHGGFIGIVLRTGYDTTGATQGVYINKCESDCTFDITDTYSGEGHFGGFIGRIDRDNAKKARSVVINDSYNNTVFDLDKPNSTSFIHYGGFIGSYMAPNDYDTYVKLSNCNNYGDISLTIKRRTNLGGFIGYFANWKEKKAMTVAVNCVNYGDITYDEVAGTAADGGRIVGGFLGLSNHCGLFEIDNFVNKGALTMNSHSDTASQYIAGGVIGFFGTASGDYATISNSANEGAITVTVDGTNSTNVRAAGCVAYGKFKTLDVDGFVNTGVITVNGEASDAQAAGVVGTPGAGTVTVTDSYDLSTVEDKTFTAVAGEGAAWTATISKELYTAITANAESVEFGAIITLKAYTDKIGDFTHANFDAYYTANKAAIDAKAGKELGRLYEIAKFDNGQTTLTEAELAGDNYVVNVTLNGAGNYDYVVRTFVKIGDLYIYNN